jgi:uncharacterized membrane protein
MFGRLASPSFVMPIARIALILVCVWHGVVAEAGTLPQFSLTVLPEHPEGLYTEVTSVSEHGWITGRVQIPGEPGPHGVVWTDSHQPPQLVQGLGAEFSLALDVNSRGEVVGSTSEGFSGFRWQPGLDLILMTPTTCCSSANAINDQGVAVGFAPFFTLPCGARAAFWDDQGVHPLPTLPGLCGGEAHDINESGQIVGSIFNSAAIWDRGVALEIGTVGDFANLAVGVNNHGDVVGYGFHSDPLASVIAFHWRKGEMTILPTLGGDQAIAESVNDSEWIVGMSEAPTGPSQDAPRAVIWIDGGIEDLNEMVVNPVTGLVLDHAYAVNNAGQIVGIARSAGVTRGFLLDPLNPADLDADGDVNGLDLALLLGAWGRCPPLQNHHCDADLDGNNIVNGLDLAMLLGAWTGSEG